MNKKNIIIIYIFIILELLILFNSNIIIKSVNSSSLMFIKKIFPSLFPTMVIGNILIKSNVYLISEFPLYILAVIVILTIGIIGSIVYLIRDLNTKRVKNAASVKHW